MNNEEKDDSKELEDLGMSVTKVNKKISKVKRCYLSSEDSFFSSCLGFEEKGKEEKASSARLAEVQCAEKALGRL